MRALLTRTGIGLLLVPVSFLGAGQREVVSGFVEPVLRQPYDNLFRPSPDSEPRMGLLNGPGMDAFTFPVRASLDVEHEANFSGGLPVATALRLLPDEVLWPGSFHLSPERFAGQNSGLHPGFNESDPSSVMPLPDFDSDGVPDENDPFPDDPSESADHDNDGSGDNADPDDDNDGMPDDYEARHRLDPFADDSREDPDSDGVTNGEECAGGTDPRDSASFFQFTTISAGRPGFLRLEWHGLPGRDYEVWHRPNFTPRAERLIEGLSVSLPGTLQANVPTAGGNDFFFVRVILHPPP
jgi:hypothetical protein